MYIKVTKLSKNEVEVECVESDGCFASEVITSKEAKALAVDMMSAAKKLLELESI